MPEYSILQSIEKFYSIELILRRYEILYIRRSPWPLNHHAFQNWELTSQMRECDALPASVLPQLHQIPSGVRFCSIESAQARGNQKKTENSCAIGRNAILPSIGSVTAKVSGVKKTGKVSSCKLTLGRNTHLHCTFRAHRLRTSHITSITLPHVRSIVFRPYE